MNPNVEYRFLNWDTEYFGVKSAKITMLEELNEHDKVNIISYSKKFDFITISNLNNIDENNIWLGGNTTAFITDTNIQLSKKLGKNTGPISEYISISNNISNDKEILDIASDSFMTSRFLSDPYLPVDKSQLVYYMWTKNAFNKQNKYFVVYRIDNRVMGYLLFSLHNSKCSIELIAVKQDAQGKNVGSELINALEKYLLDKKIVSIQVGTQVNNISAIRFYSKIGFQYKSLSSTYHWWPNKG